GSKMPGWKISCERASSEDRIAKVYLENLGTGVLNVTHELYRYTFPNSVPLGGIEATLLLALWSVEALHGEAQVQLDAGHLLNRSKRKCVIDADTQVGRDVNKLFVAFLAREFGAGNFKIERIRKQTQPQPNR